MRAEEYIFAETRAVEVAIATTKADIAQEEVCIICYLQVQLSI
jgi:hypothetical protein